MPKGNPKNWTGQKIHRLTFIKPTDKRSGHNIVWEAICDCGTVALVKPGKVASGETKSCGCYRKETIRTWEPKLSSARHVWRSNYNELPFETFIELSQKQCYYCSRQPYTVYNVYNTQSLGYRSEMQKIDGYFTYNGLDRVDSYKGHTIDNVVPCCIQCNEAKNDRTIEEFLSHIELMYYNTRHLR